MKRLNYTAKTICLASLMVSVVPFMFGCKSGETKDTSAVTTTASETTTEATTETTEATTSETTAETSAASVVPAGFVGKWKCEPTASDGETDTSFYAMYIRGDGYFSMYDEGAGNPGISGYMSNDTGSSVYCRFNQDDFDVPFCWTIETADDTLDYELTGDVLKLGHNDVWMTFNREEAAYENTPEPLDELLTIDIPSEFELEMEYNLDDVAWNPIVQKAYSNDKYGYLSYAIHSYNGVDCLRGYGEKADIEGDISALQNKREIMIGGESGYIGTRESDDMPDMVLVAYVIHGDYSFEFRLTNYDEQVTEEQTKGFENILSSVKFR